MIAIGMALLWASYGLAVWGWVLVKGYNVSLAEIWSPTAYLGGPKNAWKLTAAGNTVVIPNGTATDATNSTSASGTATGTTGGVNTSQLSTTGLSVEAVLQQAAAVAGWTGAQWQCLYNVEVREAGFNLTAQNPSSNAYGIAQFINGPSEYAQYGGNSTTAAGQAVAMVNYVKQRYGTPCVAWAHEQQYGWY